MSVCGNPHPRARVRTHTMANNNSGRVGGGGGGGGRAGGGGIPVVVGHPRARS